MNIGYVPLNEEVLRDAFLVHRASTMSCFHLLLRFCFPCTYLLPIIGRGLTMKPLLGVLPLIIHF